MAIRDTAGQDSVLAGTASRHRHWRWMVPVLVVVLIVAAAWPATKN